MHVQADPLCGQGVLGHQASRGEHASAAGQEADDTLLQVRLGHAHKTAWSHFMLSASDASNARNFKA